MGELKLCLLTSEMMPFAKSGGLADVAGALAVEFAKAGQTVHAFMPLYAAVRAAHGELQPVPQVQHVPITIGETPMEFSLRRGVIPGSAACMFFIDCPPLFDRAALYTTDPDEHRRFLLFTRAVVESCLRTGFVPDIFQCNDWHTAFLPLLLKTVYRRDRALANARSVLTIHNIGYQGIMPSAALADLGLGRDAARLDPADRARGIINPLKTGIKFADAVTTVSPTYAREICTTQLGMGMEETLRGRGDEIVGILNGVDYREWDPRHDPYLAEHFTPADLTGKLANKRRLTHLHSLRLADSVPLLSMVSRLAEQKGIDLLFDALPAALREREFGLVVLGSGETRYVRFFEDLAAAHPGRVAFQSGYDEGMAHLIEAGSDAFLMPSLYEPCGLNQMYSLRYGTIPIVHKTGGLADSVRHFDATTGAGTGCVFNDYDAPAVRWALNTTLDWYGNRQIWSQLMQNAMAQDFSWGRQVPRYLSLFRSLREAAAVSKA
jgi:starch synthase